MEAKKTIGKETIFKKTSFFVSAYIALVGLLIAVQVLHRFIYSMFGLPLNTAINLPLDSMATALVAVCAGYCGIDRAAFASYSSKLEYGVSNVGNPASLRLVIYWTTLILVEAVALVTFFDVSLPIQQLGIALGSEVAIYAAGNKAIKLCGSINGGIDKPMAADSYSQSELRALELAGETPQASPPSEPTT